MKLLTGSLLSSGKLLPPKIQFPNNQNEKAMKRVFLLFVCLSFSVVSFGQTAIQPEPMDEIKIKAWIKREIPLLGAYSEKIANNVVLEHRVESAVLSDGRLTIRSTEADASGKSSLTYTETVTLKDVDVSKIRAVASAHEDGIFFVPMIAAANRGQPFTEQLKVGDETARDIETKSEVRVVVRDLAAANVVAAVLRLAAVLCGAPDKPVEIPVIKPPAYESTTHGGIYLAYLEPRSVPALGSSKIDASKVKFLPQRPCGVGFGNTVDQSILGVVAREIDLSDDSTALQLLQMGIKFGQEVCPPRGENFQGVPLGRTVSVSLKPGDPATFSVTNLSVIFAVLGGGTAFDTPSDSVSGFWGDSQPSLIRGYQNAPKALKLSQAYSAQKVRQQNEVLEQERQAEQKKQSEIAARSAAFVKANGVKHFVTVQQLAANPFVYQDQVVAIYGEFQQMNSATSGLFSVRDKNFVVSAIPTAKFTQEGSMVMLACRVLGNIEIKLPVLGPTLVPHLSFVGSVFCQQQGGRDYDFNLKAK